MVYQVLLFIISRCMIHGVMLCIHCYLYMLFKDRKRDWKKGRNSIHKGPRSSVLEEMS